jgi:hypothetical protein
MLVVNGFKVILKVSPEGERVKGGTKKSYQFG